MPNTAGAERATLIALWASGTYLSETSPLRPRSCSWQHREAGAGAWCTPRATALRGLRVLPARLGACQELWTSNEVNICKNNGELRYTCRCI